MTPAKLPMFRTRILLSAAILATALALAAAYTSSPLTGASGAAL